MGYNDLIQVLEPNQHPNGHLIQDVITALYLLNIPLSPQSIVDTEHFTEINGRRDTLRHVLIYAAYRYGNRLCGKCSTSILKETFYGLLDHALGTKDDLITYIYSRVSLEEEVAQSEAVLNSDLAISIKTIQQLVLAARTGQHFMYFQAHSSTTISRVCTVCKGQTRDII
ncbi:hypothetical protein INT43_007788 [Umbelopsis isabellina]|uniref:Uncharacterized protein n=1 Tax=Mortierella isabellina TaxID=91625 RepID=A0A8H7PN39_MORIS|nr:hypothetical protein INT43_007788 [Umbelopsis isabellina]